MAAGSQLRIALTQSPSTADVEANLAGLLSLFREAAAGGSDLVVFPENALFAGTQSEMHHQAFHWDGPQLSALRSAAAQLRVPLIMGGVKLRSNDQVFNRALVIDARGELVGWYDKIHAFAATVAGVTHDGRGFEQPGERPVVLDVSGVRLGLSVCFDLRFPELYRSLALAGADVLLVPSAFTRVTGRAHWEPLLRARAIENGAYVLASATVGDESLADNDPKSTYGRALAVDPWGAVIADLGETPNAWQTVVIDTERVASARRQMPSLERRCPAAYARPVEAISL